MSQELICSWFGLIPESWPPDHYSLLGLIPGEKDIALIERQIQLRMELVRRYQLIYPDQVTEAMNRLAQAFSNLLDPKQKKLYDASLGISSNSESVFQSKMKIDQANPTTTIEVQSPNAKPSAMIVTIGPDPVLGLPPPIPRLETPGSPTPSGILVPPMPGGETLKAGNVAQPSQQRTSFPPLERIDPIQEVARCAIARFNLGTRKGVYNRLRITRSLIQHWENVGKFVKIPERRLNRKSAANELDHELSVIIELLEDFPPILGQAGQPGYQVMTLSTMQLLKTFQNMDLLQRQSLSLDWYSGRNLLESHSRFVRNRGRELRNANRLQRFWRGLSSVLFDRIGLILILIALVALNLAIWRTLYETWK